MKFDESSVLHKLIGSIWPIMPLASTSEPLSSDNLQIASQLSSSSQIPEQPLEKKHDVLDFSTLKSVNISPFVL